MASLASISKTINYAEEGVNFSVLNDSLYNIPKARGLYRPDLEITPSNVETRGWRIAIKVKKGEAYLVRFELKYMNKIVSPD